MMNTAKHYSVSSCRHTRLPAIAASQLAEYLCHSDDNHASWNEACETLATHYWATELHTPFNTDEITEALGEMSPAQYLELAEAHAEKDDAVLGRYIKKIVNRYWEDWCLARAEKTLHTLTPE